MCPPAWYTEPAKTKKPEQSEAYPVGTANIDNATLASMLAELRADLISKPDLLVVRFESKLAVIDCKLDGIQNTVPNHEQRISDLESGLNQLQSLESTLVDLANDNAQMKAKLTNLKGRSRRWNLRLTGAPESVEGAQPTFF